MTATRIPTLRAWGRAPLLAARAVRRAAPGVARVGARWLGSPAVLGGAYLLVITAASASGPLVSETERVLGDNSSRIEAWVNVRFADTILALKISFALTAIVVGAALGALSGAAIELRRWSDGRPPLRPSTLLPASLALTVVLHAAIWVRAMAATPQLYADQWYGHGGWRAAAQIFITDVLGTRGADCILLALFVLLAPPPWRLPALLRRAAAALRRFPPGLVAGLGALALAAGLLTLGRPGPVAPRSPEHRPNILILGADSFRDEALDPRVMPRLSAFAERHGVRFSDAHVSMARTLSSWVTTLTGRYAHHHGLRSMFPRWEDHDHDLDTLPGRLARAGYRTGVVSDYAGDVFSSIDLGFQRATVPHFSFGEVIRARGFARAEPLLPFLHTRLGRRVFPPLRELPHCADTGMLADDAIAMLRDLRASPFFLTVFFSAPHAPYAAAAPYYRRFTDPAYRGRYRYHKSSWIAPDEITEAHEVAQIRGLYQGTLASVDEGAGKILDELGRLGLAADTIVIVLGDHGENLVDAPGRFYGHGNHLFGDHDLHIPLVIADPRRDAARVETGVVTNLDLAPTLYQLTGVAPPADLDGISLAPALAGAALPQRPIFAETELWVGLQPDVKSELRFPCPEFIDYAEVDGAHGDDIVIRREYEAVTTVARHRMVRDGGWKLLYIPTATQVLYQLFDTAADPENLTDVSAAHPEVVSRLKGLLWPWMLQDPKMEERRGYLAPRGVKIPEIDGSAR